MTTYTSTAFKNAFDINFDATAQFLNYFQKKGCFLDDLCLTPVDKMKESERESHLKNSVEEFSERLLNYNPPIIIIVLKKIEKYIYESVIRSRVNAKLHVLPFPGNGHQNKYIEKLEVLTFEIRITKSHAT